MHIHNIEHLIKIKDCPEYSANECDLSNDLDRDHKEIFETLQYRIDQIDRDLSDIVMKFS